MKRIDRFKKFFEAEEAQVDASKYTEIKKEIKEMIEKTVDNSGGSYETLLDKLSKKDAKIEGLINDSDVYDFYLKYRNDIDEILNDLKFFGESPSSINAIGLYDYVIKGTQRAIEESVRLLSEE